ncbi:enoyl-CoA hydratase [Azospirillum sp. TSH7]|uniref:enoyl-CoA hydratase/isomerase family protein n=1 Tax=unclassified Azospirillum TaxID=2630922 RepID=UPI000D604457|nr:MULTISPECIES: enoyl-CoA hydratase/isomerase family protein [unclassified Azospirillum]PWC57105.1 enoyl-CoA hydratase [Azospirillum sp. TSH7]PWC63453.1 enoyl-CoA hydratase [Azospirillum sp. TSH20]
MIGIEKTGRVCVITLDRPKRRNALGEEVMKGLAAALRAAEQDPDVGAVVLTGAPPAFCAGSDLKELGGQSIAAMCGHEAETAAIARTIAYMSKPVVAAVEGYALGGGFILAVCCDIVVTARGTRWHLPEVQNGWLPPWGLQALVARVGGVKARLLTWGVEPILGDEALRLGIADYAAEDGAALDRAKALTTALAALPANAVATTKRFFEAFAAADAERADMQASRLFAEDCLSPAARATFDRFTVKS